MNKCKLNQKFKRLRLKNKKKQLYSKSQLKNNFQCKLKWRCNHSNQLQDWLPLNHLLESRQRNFVFFKDLKYHFINYQDVCHRVMIIVWVRWEEWNHHLKCRRCLEFQFQNSFRKIGKGNLNWWGIYKFKPVRLKILLTKLWLMNQV